MAAGRQKTGPAAHRIASDPRRDNANRAAAPNSPNYLLPPPWLNRYNALLSLRWGSPRPPPRDGGAARFWEPGSRPTCLVRFLEWTLTWKTTSCGRSSTTHWWR